ncbi:YbaB/EbfC family nucleoid-associated protein [Actinoalloteichus hymeniacidonis]|uniref:YbaB/EbfC family nucleoid-associated protein n=1 Tax=Actinoalloteichus hymeniacidonis TaxID=340345 RepID=UPI0012FA67D4|nr:YbaB/EbfC family nucleoid-associated protein [Actinoalloteichus hymeniacidonis]MBB5906416.1 hypothetical protein [Actinoalloteichus hymeniacidonis]
MTDHQANVERLLGEYRRSREQLGEVHRRLAEISETVTSPDSSVAVTVGHRGIVQRVWIADHAYRRYRPADLAVLVTHTIQVASASVAAVSARVASEVLAPGEAAGRQAPNNGRSEDFGQQSVRQAPSW